MIEKRIKVFISFLLGLTYGILARKGIIPNDIIIFAMYLILVSALLQSFHFKFIDKKK